MSAVLMAYDPNDVRPGWIALGLMVALGLATYLLWRSMNTQLRNIQMPKAGAPAPPPDSDSNVDDRAPARPDDRRSTDPDA